MESPSYGTLKAGWGLGSEPLCLRLLGAQPPRLVALPPVFRVPPGTGGDFYC